MVVRGRSTRGQRGGPRTSDKWLSLVHLREGRTRTTGKRKRHSAEFKARVALEALRGELTAAQHGVHQTVVGEWKQAMEGLTAGFSGKAEAQEGAKSAEAEEPLGFPPPAGPAGRR